MILPEVPDDDYHNRIAGVCLAMAHMDWARQFTEQRAHGDAMLESSWNKLHEWEQNSMAMNGMSQAAALWVGHRFLAHVGQYGRLGADYALVLLQRRIAVDPQALDTVLSKSAQTKYVLPLIEGFIQRLAQQQQAPQRQTKQAEANL